MSASDPVSIDAVAAAIGDVWETFEAGVNEEGFPERGIRTRSPESIARALAEGGWLKDPADRVLTGKMAASLHRIGSKHGLDNIDPDHDFTNDDLLTIARSGADYRFRRTDDGARRVAAGGTAKVCNAVRPEDCNGEHCDCPPAGGTAPADPPPAELRCSHGCAVSECPDPASHHAYVAPADPPAEAQQ